MKASYLCVNTFLVSITLIYTLELPLLHGTSLCPWESVASVITERYSALMHDVQIICENTSPSDEFLKTSSVPVYLSEPRLQDNSFLILLPQTRSFLTSVLHAAANCTTCKYIVLVECTKCITVEWILEQFWLRKLLNVVVIPVKNETLPVFTYFPFREGACFDSSPMLIASLTSASMVDVELFPKQKVWNLRKCTLRVASFNYYPGIYFEDEEMKGRFAPVFKAVASFMNFIPEFIFAKGSFGSASGRPTGVRGAVYTKQAHIGFMPYMVHIDYDHLDYDSLAMTACLTWCVPATFKQKSIWWLIVGEFEPSVWLCLFLAASGTVVTYSLTHAFDWQMWVDSKDDMYTYVWTSLLRTFGGKPQYYSISLRVLRVFWLQSFLVLSTVYISTMKSFRTAPYIEYSVQNLEDLAESGIQVWHQTGLSRIVDEVSKTNKAVAELKSGAIVFSPDMSATMVNMLQYENITVLMLDKQCRMYSERYAKKLELYPLSSACMQVISHHVFVMSKKSVFTEAVVILLGRLTQAGIVGKSFSQGKVLSRSTVIHQRPITVQDMVPAAVLLSCGLGLSVLVLLFERIWFRWNVLLSHCSIRGGVAFSDH